MLRVRNLSISRKLTWLNLLVSGTALLVAFLALISYDFYIFRVRMVNSLSTQAEMIGTTTVSALLFNDPSSAGETLAAFKASPHVIYAGIYTTDGRPFAEYWRHGTGVAPQPRALNGRDQIHWFEDDQLVLVHSISSEGKPVGVVYLRSDLLAMTERLRGYTIICASLFVVCLGLTLLLSRVFQRIVSEPVIGLAKTAQIVSQEKNYSVRAPVTGNNDEVAALVLAFNEMLEQIQERDAALLHARDELEQRVRERTAQLEASNNELEAFSYSVSHDLRAPLRSIDGFSQALLEDYADKVDETGQDQLRRVRAATQRMSALIDDLLNLARVARSEMIIESLDLSALARSIASELHSEQPERKVEFVIEDELRVKGDSRLMRLVMQNLLGNAWKYTSSHDRARVEVGRYQNNGQSGYFVRDDGAGFDPRYATRLFGAFQRLHSASEFPGTGVGLAIVQRIIRRHGGEIWAEAEVQKGATFYFTL